MKGLIDVLSGKEKIAFPSIKHNTSKVNFNMSLSFKGFDSDGDGVIDFKDCKPFDKRRQHIKPNKKMMEELKKLPILFHSGDLDATEYPKRAYTIDGHVAEGGKFTKAKSIPANVKKAIRRFLMVVKERPDVIKNIRRSKTWVLFTIKGDGFGFVPLHGRYAVVTLKGWTGVPFGYHSKNIEHDFMFSDVQEGAGTIHHELEHIKQHQTLPPSKKHAILSSKKEKKKEMIKIKMEIQARKKERREKIRRYRHPTQKEFSKGLKSHLLTMDELSGKG